MINDVLNVFLALPSQHVIYGGISTVLCIAGAWVYSHGTSNIKLVFFQTISWLVVFNEIFFQLNMVYYGIWDYRTSLPLEMCYLSSLLIPVYYRFPNIRSLKSWFFFAGFGGSFFAFLNTNLSNMDQIYVSIHYFFAHGLVIFVMLVIVVDGYRPNWSDYFDSVKWTTILVSFIMTFNYLFGSNYMFTVEKPAGVNFTLLMPDWPYYFIFMLMIGLAFYTILMLVSFIPEKK